MLHYERKYQQLKFKYTKVLPPESQNVSNYLSQTHFFNYNQLPLQKPQTSSVHHHFSCLSKTICVPLISAPLDVEYFVVQMVFPYQLMYHH